MSPLEGRVALVTGAGAGMGAATARVMAAAGAAVVVADRDASAAQEVADGIAEDGGSAAAAVVDVADEEQVSKLVATTVGQFGRLDCAVNNAGVAPDRRATADADLDEFDRIVAVNLRGVLACLKHELRQMISQGTGGSIVNVGSVRSLRGKASCPIYTAAKHGVIGLTTSAALEGASSGIRVNAVCPGAVDTPMLRTSLAAVGVSDLAAVPGLGPLGRLGQADEIAQVAAWLCSDAAGFVTGQAIGVDGGYLAA